MFNVLTPVFEKTGERTVVQDPGQRPYTIYWERVKEWAIIGQATSYAEAREKFGGRPVLELISQRSNITVQYLKGN